MELQNVRLSKDGNAVVILDQTLLPNKIEYLSLHTPEQFHEAIYALRVRGAPAIGICAAYAMYVLAKQVPLTPFPDFFAAFQRQSAYLNSSRPTAVNLKHALDRMERAALANKDGDLLGALKTEAVSIHQEDIDMCLCISEYGLELVKNGDGILTHCNAGPLATSRYGTGLGPILLGTERGMTFHAYCDETRPLLQGARLTSFELEQAGVDCTLICDNMASALMKSGKINACFVGCDRVAANGDTANKIGTSGVAVLASYYKIPFYVFCPSSTIDFSCETGDGIEIEQRPAAEIKEKFFVSPMALPETKCWNPAFDVTDNHLITAIITEKGIVRPPFTTNLANLFLRKETQP